MSVSASRIEGGFNVARFHFQSASCVGVAEFFIHHPSSCLISEKWGINKCTVISNENTKQKKTFGYSWQDYSIPREKFMFRNQQGIENDSIRVNKNTWFLRHQGNVITEWSVSRSLNSKQSPPFILFYKVWSWFNKPPLGTR